MRGYRSLRFYLFWERSILKPLLPLQRQHQTIISMNMLKQARIIRDMRRGCSASESLEPSRAITASRTALSGIDESCWTDAGLQYWRRVIVNVRGNNPFWCINLICYYQYSIVSLKSKNGNFHLSSSPHRSRICSEDHQEKSQSLPQSVFWSWQSEAQHPNYGIK